MLDTLELKLWAAMSCLLWMLETKLGFLEKHQTLLTHYPFFSLGEIPRA